MFEPFEAAVAFTPLILYLICLAAIRVSGKAWVTTGGRDTAAVLSAICGLVVVGPMELFFPKATAYLLGPWVWVPLLLLYFLFGCLLIINSRSKLVVYGRTSDALFSALVRATNAIDTTAVVDHEQHQVYLPQVNAHLRLDATPGHDCISVLAFEPALSDAFWRSLRIHLKKEIRLTSPPYPRRGWAAMGLAVVMLFWLIQYAAEEPSRMVDGFRDWLIR
ncbi:hypothetical protein [Neorhodopirellula pilleata]|uniref:Uncharacterized protein n=1 Tax=Neorhodopirellula pilleata TaxID=2714738 RepID=A0A5C6AH62_9BACT|nr:hypothetical protein [Neorhodopirellula pilleata]TWT98800.1 hypothetical protein Pla100_19660 [Neorhodopirellula pilleata]